MTSPNKEYLERSDRANSPEGAVSEGAERKEPPADCVDFFLYGYCVWGWFTPEGECLHISSGPGKKALRFKDLGIGLSVAVHEEPYITVRFLAWSDYAQDLPALEDEMLAKHNPRFKKPQQIQRSKRLSGEPIVVGRDRKERPRCRSIILKNGWRPLVNDNNIWDGLTGTGPEGIPMMLSVNLRTQMRKMAAEGQWGQIKIVNPWRKK